MGLLDSLLYNTDTYGGQGGGLLGMLQNSMMQQNAYQPSAGFPQQGRTFDSATFDPATYAPSQPPNTIAVGGYQMPRVGNPDQFVPQQAMTPPNAQPAQGQMPSPQPAQPQNLPPAFGSQSGSNALTGLQSFLNGGGLISSIRAAANGQRSDPAGVAQQNLTAQYQALVPIVGHQKAMLAVMNPEAGKTILAQALEKQQPTFGVIGEADGGGKAYGFIDPTKRTVTPYTAPGSENRGTVTGPDGKEIPIPPGVDPKTFRNEISKSTADALTGKKTEVQAKSEKFANKMETAEKNVSGIINEGTSVVGRGLDMVPGGNFLQGDKYQKYRQAQDNFITALLRDESGAAIGTPEFKRYERELFPQPGDGADVIAQKAEARKTAIEAMKKSAGPGYKSPSAPQSSGLPQGWSVQVR